LDKINTHFTAALLWLGQPRSFKIQFQPFWPTGLIVLTAGLIVLSAGLRFRTDLT
jgi:hypothetical protein